MPRSICAHHVRVETYAQVQQGWHGDCGLLRFLPVSAGRLAVADDADGNQRIECWKVSASLTVPWSIPAQEQRDLTWFFGDPQVATIRQSNFAAQLERSWLFGPYRPCTVCGGNGGRRYRVGTGFVPVGGRSYRVALRDYRKRMAKQLGYTVAGGERAERLKLLGIETITTARLAEFFPELPPLECTPCNACGGIGVVADMPASGTGITVRPTGSSVRGIDPDESVRIDEVAVTRWESVRVRLRKATSIWSGAEPILRGYFQPGGSYRDLWHWTVAGQKLLESANGMRSRPVAYFDQISASQTFVEESTKRLLEGAQQEAIELLKEGGRAWNKAGQS